MPGGAAAAAADYLRAERERKELARLSEEIDKRRAGLPFSVLPNCRSRHHCGGRGVWKQLVAQPARSSAAAALHRLLQAARPQDAGADAGEAERR